jgi:hypothetical protein
MPTENKPTCFIAMPISTPRADAELYADDEHWKHVMDSLFVPAVEAAGFEPVKPVMQGADLIYAQIIKHLELEDLVLCDLSGHNPNVFFELGVRTSLDKPIALVRDEHTDLPFDTSGVNTHRYGSALRVWDMEKERADLTEHVKSSAESCDRGNPLWRKFGLTLRAQETDVSETPLEAKMDLLMAEVMTLRSEHQLSTDSPPVTKRHDIGPLHRIGVPPASKVPPSRDMVAFMKRAQHLFIKAGIRTEIVGPDVIQVYEADIPKLQPEERSLLRTMADGLEVRVLVTDSWGGSQRWLTGS